MADQLQGLVQQMQAEGVPEADILAFVNQFDGIEPVPSHGPAPKRPEQILAESEPDYMGGDPNLGQRGLDLLPMIAAGAAAAASGPGIVLPAIAAGGAGYLGARVRGDSREDAASEGLTQGALQGAGGLAVKGLKIIAHGLMRGTVPKNIATEFDDVDIAQTALDRGAVPGSASSARRVEGLSRTANAERDAAAATVPPLSRSRVIDGLRPLHARATAARVPEMAADVLEQMRTSARQIGPAGMSGPDALARKDIMQSIGKAAVNAPNPRQAAFGPQLANAERGAIVSHLRETPRMATALDESQKLMALDRVMKDAAHSNIVTRGRIGGLPAMAMSPGGLALTAHGVNQGSRLLDPQVIRLLDLLMRDGAREQ